MWNRVWCLVAVLCLLGWSVGAPPGVLAQTDSDEATVQAGADGFRVVSSDGAFAMRLRADLYADARVFVDSNVPTGQQEFFLRRARLRLQGRIYDRFGFSIRPDFGIGGPEIDDAYVEALLAPAAQVRMGRFKVPVGLENLQSSTGLMHVERGFPTGLVPGRDVGVMLHGAVGGERVHYAIGAFNGAPGASEPGNAVDDAVEGAARLFLTPFAGGGPLEGLGVGVAGTLGSVTGTSATPALLSLRTTGRQTFFGYRSGAVADGQRWRVAPQARLFAGPLELLGEYTVTSHEVRLGPVSEGLTHRAWQASASVVVTGERARDGEVVPQDPFAAEAGLGAFEIGARVHGVSFDDDTFPVFAAPSTTASDATAYGLTASWYPNTMMRVMLGYERTGFDTAGPASSLATEHMLLFRTQIAF